MKRRHQPAVCTDFHMTALIATISHKATAHLHAVSLAETLPCSYCPQVMLSYFLFHCHFVTFQYRFGFINTGHKHLHRWLQCL